MSQGSAQVRAGQQHPPGLGVWTWWGASHRAFFLKGGSGSTGLGHRDATCRSLPAHLPGSAAELAGAAGPGPAGTQNNTHGSRSQGQFRKRSAQLSLDQLGRGKANTRNRLRSRIPPLGPPPPSPQKQFRKDGGGGAGGRSVACMNSVPTRPWVPSLGKEGLVHHELPICAGDTWRSQHTFPRASWTGFEGHFQGASSAQAPSWVLETQA